MLLSEAIRLGAMLGPQLFGKLLDEKGGSCVLGAIYIATGLDCQSWFMSPLPHCFSSLSIPDDYSVDVESKMMMLNDHDHWTREQIADWVIAKGLDCEYVPLPSREEVPQPQEAVCC